MAKSLGEGFSEDSSECFSEDLREGFSFHEDWGDKRFAQWFGEKETLLIQELRGPSAIQRFHYRRGWVRRVSRGLAVIAAVLVGLVAAVAAHAAFAWPIWFCAALGLGGAFSELMVFWRKVVQAVERIFLQGPYADLDRHLLAKQLQSA